MKRIILLMLISVSIGFGQSRMRFIHSASDYYMNPKYTSSKYLHLPGADLNQLQDKIEVWTNKNKYTDSIYYIYHNSSILIGGRLKLDKKTNCNCIDLGLNRYSPQTWIPDTIIPNKGLEERIKGNYTEGFSLPTGKGSFWGKINIEKYDMYGGVSMNGTFESTITLYDNYGDANRKMEYRYIRCDLTELTQDFYSYLKKTVKHKPIVYKNKK